MARRTERTDGGAKIERINALHEAMVEAAHAALKNEIAAGEIKPATLNTIRQICTDAGVSASHPQSEAMEKLQLSLANLDLTKMPKTYTY